MNFMLLKALPTLSKTSRFLLFNPLASGSFAPWTPLSSTRPSLKQIEPILFHYSGYTPVSGFLQFLSPESVTFLIILEVLLTT
jgi:hypothetical protein